mgnify:CR=1 FL=1
MEQENSKKLENIIKELNNFGYCNSKRSLENYYRNAKKENKSIEKYLLNVLNNIKIEKSVEEYLNKMNIPIKNKRIYLGHARRNNFNSGNEFKDLQDYFDFKEKERQNILLDNQKANDLLKSRGIPIEYIAQQLTHASTLGFKGESRYKNLLN